MKKSFILLLLIVITGILIADCAMDSVSYCPYCGSMNISSVAGEPGVYQCDRPECGKKFGAKEIIPDPK